MFTVVRTTTNLSLDEHFLKNPAATFFVMVDGDDMEEHGIFKGDTLIIDRSLNPEKNSIVIAVIDGELTVRNFSTIDNEEATVWGVVLGRSVFENHDEQL
jgi:DNA polymerase V